MSSCPGTHSLRVLWRARTMRWARPRTPACTTAEPGATSRVNPDLIPDATPEHEIEEPHRSTVAAILYAAGQDLFTTAEADILIDRARRSSPLVRRGIP